MRTTIEIIEQALQRGMNHRPQIGGFPYLAEALREVGVPQMNEFFQVAKVFTRPIKDLSSFPTQH